MPKIVILWTDVVVLLLVVALAFYAWQVRGSADLRAKWRRVFQDAPALGASVLLVLALGVTLLDSLHYRPLLPAAPGATQAAYDTRTWSLLDAALGHLVAGREASYSPPLACEGFTKESVTVGGQVERIKPRLQFGCRNLAQPASQWAGDVGVKRRRCRVVGGGCCWPLCCRGPSIAALARGQAASIRRYSTCRDAGPHGDPLARGGL